VLVRFVVVPESAPPLIPAKGDINFATMVLSVHNYKTLDWIYDLRDVPRRLIQHTGLEQWCFSGL
jgi:hypothetical protein